MPSEEEREERTAKIWKSLKAFHRITEELEIDYFIATVSILGREIRTCPDVEIVLNRRHKSKLANHFMRERYYGEFQLTTLPGNGLDAKPLSKEGIWWMILLFRTQILPKEELTGGLWCLIGLETL